MSRLVLILALGSGARALQVPAVFTRRAAVTGLVALPCAASAAEFSGYKERDYGNGENTAVGTVGTTPKKPITQCEEGQRLSPDGFGGKKCTGPVKGVAQRAIEGVVGGDGSSSPPPPRSAPKAAPSSVGLSTRSSSTPSAPLTFDELLKNSIANKEVLLGRPLSDLEKSDMAYRLKKLME